jgi:hypothetical protein
MKEWRKYPKWNPKKAGVAILIYDKADFKPNLEEIRSLHIDKGSNPIRKCNRMKAQDIMAE